jgi:hypothetical protein
MYLGELSFEGYTPTARQFGAEVLAAQADVLTFNYDTLAEEAIGFASGVGNKPVPATRRQGPTNHQATSDDDLDASHLSWKRPQRTGSNLTRSHCQSQECLSTLKDHDTTRTPTISCMSAVGC